MNEKSINIWTIYFLVTFSVTCLIGCASANNSSCLVEADQSEKPDNRANVKPLLCANNEVMAIIQPDGNVYTYDVCQEELAQLTFDGLPDSSYYFFDNSASWPADASKLLTGKDSSIHVINLQDGNQTSIGEKVIFAAWSPDSRKIVTVQLLGEEDKPWEREHNAISIIDIQSLSNVLSFEGTAPVWMSNSELIYFAIEEAEDPYISNNVVEVSLDGEEKNLCPKIRTRHAPPRYTRLSTDKRYGAVYSAVQLNLAVFSLDSRDTFSVEWIVNSGKAMRWSPTEPLLAICTGGHGGMDGPLPETALGAMLMVEPNHPPKIFNDQRCLHQSQVEWHPSGNIVAYLNTDYKLTFIDVVAGEYLSQPIQSDKLKIDKGPWWSPSGHYIGVISDNKIYVAKFNEEELVFEYVADGVDMSWQPLKSR